MNVRDGDEDILPHLVKVFFLSTFIYLYINGRDSIQGREFSLLKTLSRYYGGTYIYINILLYNRRRVIEVTSWKRERAFFFSFKFRRIILSLFIDVVWNLLISWDSRDSNVSCEWLQVCIKLKSEGNFEECWIEAINNWSRPSDFPAINPTYSGSKNTFIYAASCSNSRRSLPHFPFDTITKLDLLNNSVSTWSVESRRFIGEPIFVPKGIDEEDGYLIAIEVRINIYLFYTSFTSSI